MMTSDMEPDADAWRDEEGVETADAEPRDVVAALVALAEPDVALAPGLLTRMSGVTSAEIDAWHSTWIDLPDEQRRAVARALLEGAEADVHLDFGSVFRLLLEDDDAEVRALAVDGLWESIDPRLARRFTALLREDSHAEVRARAAEALGTFIELGEFDRLDAALRDAALEALIESANDPDESPEVRRRATASAGYADHDAVRTLLAEGLASEELLLRIGAVRGIGNSADDAWATAVMRALADREAEIRFEAVRAAGELELAGTVALLDRLIADDEAEIRQEAIWALGEIGGDAAQAILERLLRRARSDDEREAIEDALSVSALHRNEITPVSRSMLGLGTGDDDDDDDDDWVLDDDQLALDSEAIEGEDVEDELDDLDAAGDWRGAIEDDIDDDTGGR